MACTRSSAAWLFSTYPRIPAWSARATYGSSACIVNRIVRVRGDARVISRAASSPFSIGIARSSTTTSGFSCAAISIAAWPSATSPSTRNPSRSRSARTPWRKILWSSAKRIRSDISVPERDGDEQLGALPLRRLDRQRSAQGVRPLPDPDEAEASLPAARQDRRDAEAYAVIPNGTTDGAFRAPDLDVHPSRLRMAHGVGQRLLHAPVEGRLHGRRQPPFCRALHRDDEPASLRHPVRQELQGRQEPEVVEDGRPELVGQPAEFLLHLIEEFPDGVEARASPRRQPVRELLQRQMHSAEQLARVVVERVGDPLRFLLQPLVQAPQGLLRLLALGHIPRDAVNAGRPAVLMEQRRVHLHRDPPPVPGHDLDLVPGPFDLARE